MKAVEQFKTMGTWPVFLTAISTILGAILFLRFGYSIAHIGLSQTLLIILLGFDFDSSKAEDFEIYHGLGDTMFVYASQPKLIK